MFNLLKYFLESSPIIKLSQIYQIDIKKKFQKNGFFIIKNFFDLDKQNFYLKELNKSLDVINNKDASKVLTDSLNDNKNFINLVLDNNLNFLNCKLLGDDHIFLQNFDLHANENAHQWHRDLSTKDGKILEIDNDDFLLIKYAIYLKIQNSAFFLIKNSHRFNKGSEIFGQDLYKMETKKFFDMRNFSQAQSGDIIYYKPNAGDLVGFDYRMLHSAGNINNDGIPSKTLGQKEKKVMWPTYGKRNFYTEAIYQYLRFIRKDWAIKGLDNLDIHKILLSKNHLPKTYENISNNHIDWCQKNLMYGAEHDLCIYDDENSPAVMQNRLEFIKRYSKDNKYDLLKRKQEKIIGNLA